VKSQQIDSAAKMAKMQTDRLASMSDGDLLQAARGF